MGIQTQLETQTLPLAVTITAMITTVVFAY